MLTLSLITMHTMDLGISYGRLVFLRIFQASGLAFLFIPINTHRLHRREAVREQRRLRPHQPRPQHRRLLRNGLLRHHAHPPHRRARDQHGPQPHRRQPGLRQSGRKTQSASSADTAAAIPSPAPAPTPPRPTSTTSFTARPECSPTSTSSSTWPSSAPACCRCSSSFLAHPRTPAPPPATKLTSFFRTFFWRGFCEKWAEVDGFWWLAGGKKCGKCGLLMVAARLLKTCQLSERFLWKSDCLLRMGRPPQRGGADPSSTGLSRPRSLRPIAPCTSNTITSFFPLFKQRCRSIQGLLRADVPDASQRTVRSAKADPS